MTADRKTKELARRLVQLSLEDGLVSDARVREVVEALRSKPRPGLARLMRAYLYYLRKEIRASYLMIEHGGEISEETVSTIRRQLESEYNRRLAVTTRENPDLIAGVRIHVRDEVIDNTVSGRLEALRTRIH